MLNFGSNLVLEGEKGILRRSREGTSSLTTKNYNVFPRWEHSYVFQQPSSTASSFQTTTSNEILNVRILPTEANIGHRREHKFQQLDSHHHQSKTILYPTAHASTNDKDLFWGEGEGVEKKIPVINWWSLPMIACICYVGTDWGCKERIVWWTEMRLMTGILVTILSSS